MRLSPIMSAGTSTVIVGLNAALQKRFVLPPHDNLIPGNVHRAASVTTGVGGKGQDVAVTLHSLRYTGNPQVAQFLGSGAEGDQVYRLLSDLLGKENEKNTAASRKCMDLTVRTASGMRTCTSIVGADSTTELVEPSGVILEEELQDLLDKLQHNQPAVCDALCVMGSLPPGAAPDTYARIYQAAALAVPTTTTESSSSTHPLCVIDSVAGLPELWRAISDRRNKDNQPPKSTLLKINAAELCRLAGVVEPRSQAETAGVAVPEVVEAVSAYMRQYPEAQSALTAMALTDGAHPAYLAVLTNDSDNDDDKEVGFDLYRLPVPDLKAYHGSNKQDDEESLLQLYPIGAGDSVAAGTLAAWKCLSDDNENNRCLPDAIAQALNQQKDEIAATITTTTAATDQQQVGPLTTTSNVLLTAFAFGLACGSASCLQEENSVLKVEDAIALLQQGAAAPAFVSRHKLAMTTT